MDWFLMLPSSSQCVNILLPRRSPNVFISGFLFFFSFISSSSALQPAIHLALPLIYYITESKFSCFIAALCPPLLFFNNCSIPECRCVVFICLISIFTVRLMKEPLSEVSFLGRKLKGNGKYFKLIALLFNVTIPFRSIGRHQGIIFLEDLYVLQWCVFSCGESPLF